MDGLIIDSFAGGGGASLGIAWATGRAPDVAINHNADALAMHAANHPSTVHLTEDVWKVNPRAATKGRRVGLLWLSPDCKHFSRAKGGKPVEKKIRSLAWVAVKWAAEVKPNIIILENVREFADWGPLIEGRPCPDRKGLTFRRFIGRLRNLGYSKIEYRNLNAADYGAPTHRRRLFVVARRDSRPIVWPEPTHGDPTKLDATPLFGRLKPWRTAAECIDWDVPCPSIFDRKRPLKDATLRRIAEGVRRYVLGSAKPFILPITHTGERRVPSVDEPLATITSAKRGEFALVAPVIANLAYGESSGTFGESRTHHMEKPLTTIHAGGGNHALVTAFLAKHFGGQVGVGIDTPLPTTTTRGTQNQIVAANLVRFNFDDAGIPVTSPLPTVLSNNHAALVYSFLSSQNVPLAGRIHNDRVFVIVNGNPWCIVDIGMRMLTPRELARAQGFPDTYLLTGNKTNQVARIGNSVCPHVAAALVKANCVNASVACGA